jgi:hypothetical protein
LLEKRQPHEGNSFRPPAIDNHRSSVPPFMIPRGNHENEALRFNESRSSAPFIQRDPVRLQARILRPTEVGCKLPAIGNAELRLTKKASTR